MSSRSRASSTIEARVTWSRAVAVAAVLIAATLDASAQQRSVSNTIEPDGTTALHHAVQRADADTVRALIRTGANVNAKNRYGIAPLQLAATVGNAAIV